MPTRIVLVDDHRMIRQALRAMLDDQADFQVVGEADNGRTSVELCRELRPDVVVMDLQMPLLNGIDATRQLVELGQDIQVICLSAFADERTTAEVLRAGARGYVQKEAAFEELATAIQTVMKDKVYLSPTVAGMLVGGLVNGQPGSPSSLAGTLSNREREVLQLIAEGKTTKDVASCLKVSVKTAETHRRNLMEKLKIDSIAELTKLAVREGLTTL